MVWYEQCVVCHIVMPYFWYELWSINHCSPHFILHIAQTGQELGLDWNHHVQCCRSGIHNRRTSCRPNNCKANALQGGLISKSMSAVYKASRLLVNAKTSIRVKLTKRSLAQVQAQEVDAYIQTSNVSFTCLPILPYYQICEITL